MPDGTRLFDEHVKVGRADDTRVWADAKYGGPEGRPVMLTIRDGVMGLQDYYTPEEAEQLADTLKRAAAAARSASEATS